MFLQDGDGNRKEKKVKEQEKKEKDMIIFQEMITIPNQEEIDELVEGNSECTPGGTQKSFIRGGSAPRSNPLPFYISFFQKRYPFRIPFIGKRHPFHIPS